MADPIATPAQPKDFAEMAIQTVRTHPDAPAKAPEPKPAAAAAPAKTPEPAASEPRKLPDELFGGKKEAKVDQVAEPVSDIDKIADPKFSDARVEADWKGLKGKAKEKEKLANEFQAKAADLEKRIADFEAKGKETEGLQAKLATLEKEHAESMALVRKVNAELDPAYQQKRTERNGVVNDLKKLVKDSGGDPDAMESALRLNGAEHIKAVTEVIGDLPNYIQGIIGAKIAEVSALDRAMDAAKGNPEEYLQGRQREMQEKEASERAEFARTVQLAYSHADEKMSSDLEVLRPVEGLDWWNKQAETIRANARRNFETNTDPQVAAEMCLKAEAMPVYRDLFKDERSEHAKTKAALAEREAELKKLYGTAPQLRGTQNASTDGGHRDFATRTVDSMQGR